MPEPLVPDQTPQADFIHSANEQLIQCDAEERVAWALVNLPGAHVLSSSFGVQAALMLHLVTRVYPRIPVVFIDTGYLFPETYQFVDTLSARLDLNLHVYRSPISPAWQEARHGRLWENGVGGIEHYNRINKVEPMARALEELGAGTWLAGLRRAQSRSRSLLPVLAKRDGRFKLHPVIDWSERDVYRYLKQHALPYHPLWERGYVSVGDTHTSRPLEPGMLAEETRFFGLKRECGLHE
jgi:phosphoadenosine phosphosulfate reductase